MNIHIDNKPKFKAGDWITNGACVIQITSVDDEYYWQDNDCVGGDIESIDKGYHLWTIGDAKEGDVLAYVTDEEDLWIMIYWSLYEPYEGHVHYHALLVNDEFYDKGTCCICINDLKPVTKEQYDLLFQKMKEAGYEWDAENLQLTKILHVKELSDGINIDKQKLAEWSEEDKKLTDVNHEYFSKLLENDDSMDINYYAYQVAYCMSHDWAKDNATWEDIQQACKLGALWQQKQDQKQLKKRTEEEFKSLFKKHYENGRKSMKDELLKNYISSDVFNDGKQLYTTETWDDMDALLKSINAKSGDKVKIIIVKE